MKLLKVHKPIEAKAEIEKYFNGKGMPSENVDLTEADGRILYEDIYAPISLPEFPKSTVDGYAVKASSTVGATDSMPLFLKVAGQVEMGKAPTVSVDREHGVYVPTGGMLPEGADSVVMIEYVEELDKETIAVGCSVAVGEGMINLGDDFKAGELLLEKGTRITYREVAVLAGCGIYEIPVSKKPKVAILSTGDEIVSREKQVEPGKVRDINSFALASLVRAAGGDVVLSTCLEDNYECLRDEVKKAGDMADLVVISGGSSAGLKDETAKVIDSMGDPGVFVHGVAIKPGKPTIIGAAEGKAYFGLPGHPASAIQIFQVFVEPFIKKLTGEKKRDILLRAECGANLPSAPGKETFYMVRIEEREVDKETDEGTKKGADKGIGEGFYVAIPVYGKSAAVGYLSEADGYIRIPEESEGIKKGETVSVFLY